MEHSDDPVPAPNLTRPFLKLRKFLRMDENDPESGFRVADELARWANSHRVTLGRFYGRSVEVDLTMAEHRAWNGGAALEGRAEFSFAEPLVDA